MFETTSIRYEGNIKNINNEVNNFNGDNRRSNNSGNGSFIVMKGDIWDVDLGVGIGSEQSLKRPCIIIQNDTGNKHSPTVIVAAITSQIHKAKLPVHVEIERDLSNNLNFNSVILMEQVRTVDKKRLKEKIGHVSDEIMRKVDMAMLVSVGIDINQIVNKKINKEAEQNNKIEKQEVKIDEFDINRARHLADKIKECQNRIDNNMDRSITTKLLRDKMSYISELKMYCKTFNQDHRFYYNPNANVNIERGIEGRRVVNA